jgi:hypothetical protein
VRHDIVWYRTISILGKKVDLNFVLCLPRMAVHVSTEADRPGAWFPGPLGPYTTRLPGIGLSRDFKRVKVPGNPHEKSVLFWHILGGHIT